MDAPLVLLRNEIINGVITQPILELLLKVCNNIEFKEFYNLQVNSAIYYFYEDEVSTVEEYAQIPLNDRGDYSFKKISNTVEDTRTFKWFSFYTECFIGKLI
jgi:hypothetical protein